MGIIADTTKRLTRRNYPKMIVAIETRIAELRAEREAVRADYRASAVDAFESDDSATLARRETVASRIRKLDDSIEDLTVTLDGVRAEQEREETEKADAALEAKDKAANGLLDQYAKELEMLDQKLDSFVGSLDELVRLQGEIAATTTHELAAQLGPQRLLRPSIEHRLAKTLGYIGLLGRSHEDIRLADRMLDRKWALRLAGLASKNT